MIPQDKIPHVLKYMGGKRDMLSEIGAAIDDMNVGTEDFCDLFAGTSIVSYAFSDSFNVVSNDTNVIPRSLAILILAIFPPMENRTG